MNKEQINILLEKYRNAETSVAEEQQLKAYFFSENVDAELELYKEFFQEVNKPQEHILSSSFDDKIMGKITEQPTKILTIKRQHKPAWVWQAAAMFMLLMGAALFVFSDVEQSKNKLTIAEQMEARKAYSETMLALNIVSNKLNKGQKPLLQLGKLHKTINVNYK